MITPTDYTSEPWYADPRDHGLIFAVGAVAQCLDGDGQPDSLDLTEEERATIAKQMPANARRIVACVNAMVGVPTDVLEGGARFAKLLKAARKLIARDGGKLADDMQAVRDALVPFATTEPKGEPTT